MEYRELSLSIAKELFKLLSIFTKVVEIQTIFNLRWHLPVFPSDFNNIYLKYFSILQNLTRFYEILRKFTKVEESYDIPQYFLVKSLAFVLFRWIAMYFLHFVISYCDEWNFSVCYCTVLPLNNIDKYFAIVKWKVIFPILQILRARSITYSTLSFTLKH